MHMFPLSTELSSPFDLVPPSSPSSSQLTCLSKSLTQSWGWMHCWMNEWLCLYQKITTRLLRALLPHPQISAHKPGVVFIHLTSLCWIRRLDPLALYLLRDKDTWDLSFSLVDSPWPVSSRYRLIHTTASVGTNLCYPELTRDMELHGSELGWPTILLTPPLFFPLSVSESLS